MPINVYKCGRNYNWNFSTNVAEIMNVFAFSLAEINYKMIFLPDCLQTWVGLKYNLQFIHPILAWNQSAADSNLACHGEFFL